MGRIVIVVLIVLAVLVAVGLILPAIFKSREDEERRRCENHFRQIASFGLYHSALPREELPVEPRTYFPSGTVPNPRLAFDQRCSWYMLVISALDQGPPENGRYRKKTTGFTELLLAFDPDKSWDDDVHARLARTRLTQSICPGRSPPNLPDQPALCSYLGNGGIGDAASVSLETAGPRAGFFRYDSVTSVETIRDGDGLSNSIAVIETAREWGPWLRGGKATIRSLNPEDRPYLGNGRPFSGCHRGKGNFAMADGSVRVLTDQTSPVIFKALLTIQGHEAENEFDAR